MAASCHLEQKWKALYLSNRLTHFDDLCIIWHVSSQACACWGCVDAASHFRGSNPKKLILGVWKGFLKPNVQNIQMFILSKLLQWFQPSFARWQKSPITLRGLSQNVVPQFQDGRRLPSLTSPQSHLRKARRSSANKKNSKLLVSHISRNVGHGLPNCIDCARALLLA